MAPQKKLWVKPMWECTKTINSSRFQATLKANEFELKFISAYWGFIGFDFGFINLSNAFLDSLRVPKYHFKAPNKRKAFYRTKKFFGKWTREEGKGTGENFFTRSLQK